MDAVTRVADLPFADVLEPREGPITAEGDYDTAHLADAEFHDTDGDHARFLESALTSVIFTGGRMRRARFNEVWMHSVRIVGTDLAESDWLDSALVSSSLAALEAWGARLRRVTFSGCKLDGLNLRGADLADVDFVDCTLTGVDFGGATLRAVRFPGSALRDIRLDKATMTKVDLRGATSLELASGYAGLAGATISGTQLIALAPELARELKITVKDR
jgi:uncharacterized protein YjbI with pentapeptide repeats